MAGLFFIGIYIYMKHIAARVFKDNKKKETEIQFFFIENSIVNLDVNTM